MEEEIRNHIARWDRNQTQLITGTFINAPAGWDKLLRYVGSHSAPVDAIGDTAVDVSGVGMYFGPPAQIAVIALNVIVQATADCADRRHEKVMDAVRFALERKLPELQEAREKKVQEWENKLRDVLVKAKPRTDVPELRNFLDIVKMSLPLPKDGILTPPMSSTEIYGELLLQYAAKRGWEKSVSYLDIYNKWMVVPNMWNKDNFLTHNSIPFMIDPRDICAELNAIKHKPLIRLGD